MAGVRIVAGHFKAREQAIAEIMKDGYWPISWVDKPGATYEPHRHRDDETLYLVAGAMDFTDLKTGETHRLEPGDKLLLPAGAPHSAHTQEGATYIMGIRTLVALEDHSLPLE